MMAVHLFRKGLVLLAAAGCFAFALFWDGLGGPNPLKLAVGTRLGSEALVFALTQGQPLPPSELRLIEMEGATAISRALENQVVDAAVLSLDEALQMNDAGHPVRVAFILEESVGADVLLAPPHVTGVEMLKGARVGVEVRSCGHYLLLKVLEKAGLTLTDVELIPLTEREVPSALREGAVDAMVVTEPDASRISPREARRLFDSTELEDPILRVLAVRETVWEAKKEVLKTLAQRFLREQPRMRAADAEFSNYMERRMELDSERVERCLERCRFPSREEMTAWLAGDRLGEIMKSKMHDMTEAGLLSGNLLAEPKWDVTILEP